MVDARLRAQLAQQLGFPRISCAAYDAGHIAEATRIATELRVLIHDTSNSKSPPTRFGAKHIARLPTCAIHDNANQGLQDRGRTRGVFVRALPGFDSPACASFASHW